MAKVFKVVSTDDGPGTSDKQCVTDWKKCVLCQEGTTEKHLYVLPILHVIKTLAQNLIAFDKISCLPRTLTR